MKSSGGPRTSSPRAGNVREKTPSLETPRKDPLSADKEAKTPKFTTPVASPSSKDKTSPLYVGSKKIQMSQEVTPKSKEISPRGRSRARRKRKRCTTESSSDEDIGVLPENAQEVDRNLQETAARNNMTQDSVKKILKKVVTNDHVLALVALREEEESAADDEPKREPKITRAKAKELTKSSPDGTAPWNLELTPIKHIPVKTRPEVTALIDQDMPDESDEEYQPTHDDVLSDEDQTLESCSDLDSQPRTPATPSSLPPASPQTDGPFKVPMIKAACKKRLEIEEEATIALRTRSKLCLSGTPIESIEQSFVPPDEPPPASSDVDRLWSNFLNEVLDPNRTSFRTEDDDEADPEYNVAADQDAYDEDEEALERSLVNISRKELDELYNELMGINGTVPEPIPVKQQPMDINEDQTDTSERNYLDLDHQEKLGQNNMVQVPRMPIPVKEESPEKQNEIEDDIETELQPPSLLKAAQERSSVRDILNIVVSSTADGVTEEIMEYQETSMPLEKANRPQLLRTLGPQVEKQTRQKVNIVLESDNVMEPTQVLILEQQLRQHIQLATSSYLQIYVHPRLWTYAPAYKDYLMALKKMADDRTSAGQRSVVDVCNLRAAVALVESWEQTLSADTPQNQEIVKFLEAESERCLKRNTQNVLYNGSFETVYMQVVSNSSVFVYPYLLPPLPFRCDSYRRQCYVYSEECLIALGLEQFYKHVEANRAEYRHVKSWVCLTHVISLVVKHMMPWMRARALAYHIQVMRKHKDPDHPIRKFFQTRTVEPVQHKLLAFNPNITLHEQPEYELPLKWAQFISKQNKRAQEFVIKRARMAGMEPTGVEVDIENKEPPVVPQKNPLPITQTKEASEELSGIRMTITPLTEHNYVTNENTNSTQPNTDPLADSTEKSQSTTKKSQDKKKAITWQQNKEPVKIQPNTMKVIQTPNGGLLFPVVFIPKDGTVNSTNVPIVSTRVAEITTDKEHLPLDTAKLDEKRTDKESALIVNAKATDKLQVPIVNTGIAQKMVDKEIYVDESSNITSTIYHDDSSDDETIPTNCEQRHCICCLEMRKFRKKWPLITNYFVQKRRTKRLDCCLNRKMPKKTQRLKYFITSCRNSTMTTWEDLQSRIESLDNLSVKTKDSCEQFSEHCRDVSRSTIPKETLESIEDKIWVNAYLNKLAMANFPSLRTRRDLMQLLSSFRVDKDDPVQLFHKLSVFLPGELSALGVEFVGLLTSTQADRLGMFPSLFHIQHLHKFIALISEEIKDRAKEKRILTGISSALMAPWSSACEFSVHILRLVSASRRLCQFVFDVTPHRLPTAPIVLDLINSANSATVVDTDATNVGSGVTILDRNVTKTNVVTTAADEMDRNVTLRRKNAEKPKEKTLETATTTDAQADVKDANTSVPTPIKLSSVMQLHTCDKVTSDTSCQQLQRVNIEKPPQLMEVDTPELTVSKTEIEDIYSVSEFDSTMETHNDTIKTEPVEWSRDEDKTILQAIQMNATPEETKDKTILKVLEEKEIFKELIMLMENKSVEHIKERIQYIVQLLRTDGS